MATIVVGTNSYITEEELQTYADDRGITIATVDLSILLIKAMDYIEIQNYICQKYDTTQALEFPRNCTLPDDTSGEVPNDVKNAQAVAALLTDSGNDLTPVIGRSTKKEKVDVIEVEYMDNAASTNLYPQLTMLLSDYLSSTGGSFNVVRG